VEGGSAHLTRPIIGSAMTLELFIYLGLFIILAILYHFLPESIIAESIMGPALIFAGIIFLGYVFSTINAIALANHKAEWPVILTFIQNAFGLLGLAIALQMGLNSLLQLGLIFSFSSLLAFVSGHFVLYTTHIRNQKPLFPSFEFTSIKPLYPFMLRFGAIQFFVLIIFASDHLIILHFLDANSVTEYNIAFRYFNLLNVIFNLILIPFWSAFTSAQAKADSDWIKKAIKNLLVIFAGLFALGLTMLIGTFWAYDLWLNGLVKIPFSLSAVMMISVILTMWNYLFVYYLSGIDRINLYTKLVMLSGALNIPVSIILVQLFGTVGVISATCISLLPQAIALPIQSYKLLRS
jgi:O-antigen/teichoic acid export membrane protein